MKLNVMKVADGHAVVTQRDDELVVAPGSPDLLVGNRDLSALEAGTVIDETTAEAALPLCPGKIVAIGLNYQDHVDESGTSAPEQPLVFTKFPSSMIGDGDEIVFDPELAQRVDWEVELGVVIGKTARDVSVDLALDHVFGYTVANDISARDIQFGDGQWVRGKSLDTFCPVGPVVVTASEIPEPQGLALRTRIDGETVQESNTSLMIFSVAELIAFCSRSFTLEPGDLLLTGTPWGCGEFMNPVRSLRDGEEVETGIEGVGVITNRVRTVRKEVIA